MNLYELIFLVDIWDVIYKCWLKFSYTMSKFLDFPFFKSPKPQDRKYDTTLSAS